MNGAANPLQTFQTYGTATLPRWPASPLTRPTVRARGDQPRHGLLQLIAGTIAWSIYAVFKFCLNAAVAVAIVIVLPWLLLMPVMLVSLLITILGALFGPTRPM